MNGTKRTVYCEMSRITAPYSSGHEPDCNGMMEVALISSGSGIHHIFGKSLPCARGEIYVIPENIPHGFFASDEGDVLTVESLRFRAADWLCADMSDEASPDYCYGVFTDGTPLAYAKLTNSAVSDITSLFDAVSFELSTERSGWEEAVKAYISLMFVKIKRCVEATIKTAQAAPKKERGTVSAALHIIEERYGESELTLDVIAAELILSPSHLSRLFRRYMGEPFSDFLRNYRIERACRMLVETDTSVTEIVRHCGMKDIPSFYKAFSSYKGTTPNQYRSRAREHAAEKNKKQMGETFMSILNEISENLQIGKAKIVKELVQKALDDGIGAKTILEEGLLSGMTIVGDKFKNNEIYIPEVLVAARALNMGTQLLKPYFGEAGVEPIGRVCIGTVEGDLHDIGKNLVKMMMEGKQIEVIDLGTDVSADMFVNTAINENCQIICCSALLTTTMGVMEEVVNKLKAAGMDGKIKIMIGGAPINEEFCKKIGADVYTVDAASAADAAVELISTLK